MGSHPTCDTACMVAIGLAAMGWLPVALTSIASLIAATYYATLLYDRFMKPRMLAPCPVCGHDVVKGN